MKNSNKQPIRIAHIIGKMWAGGVEAVVFNYYRAIDHKKYQFDFYYDEDSTVQPPQDLIDMGARFIELPPYQRLPQYINELRKYLREEKYIIVHSHLNTISVFPLFAAWCERVPVRIAHNHSVPDSSEWKRTLLKQFLRRFSKLFSTNFFACSMKAGRWMFGDKEFNSGNVFVVKNGVDFTKFYFLKIEIKRIKEKLCLNNSLVIGHVGRFTYAKNHLFLLDIFERIVKKRNNAKLLLVGDGELHDKIVAEIQKRKLQHNVLMIGKTQTPEIYYSIMDVIVIPSFFEGLSMATIESQIAGIPAVISKAIPEEAIISNGCHYMSLDDSAEKWANKALSICGEKVSLSEASKSYDIHKAVKVLEEKYELLLSVR